MIIAAAVQSTVAGWLLAQSAPAAGDEASSRLSMVIGALLVLAAVITVATVVFWRMTRPSAVRERPAMTWREPSSSIEDGADQV